MNRLIIYFLTLVLVVSIPGCSGCRKKEKFYTTVNTPPTQKNLTLGDGFFGDCSTTKTGTAAVPFKIKVKVRGVSGLDINGMPINYVYRSYLWTALSNSTSIPPTNITNGISSYTNTIEIPNTGGFFIDVSVESNDCVKCCTDPTSCPTNFGVVELDASVFVDGTVPVANPIVFPASLFTKTCY